MKRGLKTLSVLSALYPLCFALAPALSLYGLNRSEIQAKELIRPLSLLSLGSVVVFGVFYLLGRRSRERCG